MSNNENEQWFNGESYNLSDMESVTLFVEAMTQSYKELVFQQKDLELRFGALGIGVQYLAAVLDECDHDYEKDDHLRRFIAKLTSCINVDTSFEHAEMDCEILKAALRDRLGEDVDETEKDENENSNSNFESEDEI